MIWQSAIGDHAIYNNKITSFNEEKLLGIFIRQQTKF